MYASIQSQTHADFYCRIKENPVHAFKNFLVYELVDSCVPDDITKTVNGRPVAKFRHVALDTTGAGYLYDIEKRAIDARVGPCTYISD